MNRRVCIALIVVSAVAGIGTAATAATVVKQRHDATAKTGTHPMSATLTPITPAKTKKTKKPSIPITIRTTPPPPAVLGVGDLLQNVDLAAANFPVDTAQSTVGGGDMQYLVSPCLKSTIGGVTGGNVFSGSWYSTDNQVASESISGAINEPQAETMAQTIAGWHTGTCGDFTVGPQHRVELSNGWMIWVDLSKEQEVQEFAAVYKIGDRIGVLDAKLLGYTEATRNGLLMAAAARLR